MRGTYKRFLCGILAAILAGLLLAGALLGIRMSAEAGEEWAAVDMQYLGYQKIIFVGDSRTVYMEKENCRAQVEFIGASGRGLGWFRKEGYPRLLEMLKENTSPMPIAVVFNLGANDYWRNGRRYVPYFRSIAGELQNQNCYLFYMSVNPVEEEKQAGSEHRKRTNSEIRAFNRKLEKGLAGEYTWLAMNAAMEQKGFSTEDGLHYVASSNIYVLSHAIQMVLESGAYPQEYCWRKKGGDWYALRWADSLPVKGAWVQDGEGQFYLDAEGRLQQGGELPGPGGGFCTVGASGRKQEKTSSGGAASTA